MMDSADLTFVFPRTKVNSPAPQHSLSSLRMTVNGRAILSHGIVSSDQIFIIGSRSDFESAGSFAAPELEAEDKDFLREKLFFETLTGGDLRRYVGRYVAVHGQRIVDSDAELYPLTRRFFSAHPHAPVYIAFVGNKARHFIPGPIL